LGRAVAEGVRRREGAGAAHGSPDRLASGLARGLPAAPERRVRARRLRADGAGAGARGAAARRGRVRPPAQDARERGCPLGARLARGGRRGARGDRPRPRGAGGGAAAVRVRRARGGAPLIGSAPAKINLALVVGPLREDGKHELLTLYQRVDLADRLTVEPAPKTTVRGFEDDTIVQRALAAFGDSHGWRVTIDKRIPVSAGLGGGSADAATALRLANGQLVKPLTQKRLHAVAAATGADVPFFLADGPQLGSGDGTVLEPVELPQDFAVLLFLPAAATKSS